ncbi:nitroreductase family protein [Paenibacillus sp. FJAT-26967]|uniref:nitroreductase family protein n=1 Tax=Paenibacillus sp. FJAT-26967 TaxID=1729690 RepID=UPI0008385A5C|nr:nitroreductase family protein [Paenibacillus sp. FJAT-26967]
MQDKHYEVQNTRHAAYDINPIFLNRWSPRAFIDKQISDEILLSLFEAARWAPSASNLQPWRYILAQTKEEKQLFAEFILPANAEWCLNASVLALLISHTPTPSGGVNGSHAFDAGTSWGYLALEATRQGLSAHAMAGFDRDKARNLLNIPQEYEVHAVIAIGYHGNTESLSERNLEREQPSNRRSTVESLYKGTFGAAWTD